MTRPFYFPVSGRTCRKGIAGYTCRTALTFFHRDQRELKDVELQKGQNSVIDSKGQNSVNSKGKHFVSQADPDKDLVVLTLSKRVIKGRRTLADFLSADKKSSLVG